MPRVDTGCLSRIGWGLLCVLAIAFIAALLMPVTSSPRGRPPTSECRNNLRQLAIALINYESNHGHLPRAYTVDDGGNTLHSWRTLLLPYIDRPDLYDRIDFTKPWDDPANEAVRSAMPEIFRCPSSPHEVESGLTTYCAVVGDGFIFSSDGRRKLKEIKDGASATLLVVEVPPEHAVHWMSPENTDESVLQTMLESKLSSHPGGLIVAFADGRTEVLPLDLSKEDLRAMLTVAGGERIDNLPGE